MLPRSMGLRGTPSAMQHAVLLGRDSWVYFNYRTYHSLPPRPSDHRIFGELEVVLQRPGRRAGLRRKPRRLHQPLPPIFNATGLGLTSKLAALSGPSNACEATYRARRFAPSRITRRSKALAKWGITMRESSGGSSFSQRSTTPLSSARAAQTEMLIFCPVCQSLTRNTTELLSLIHI